MSGRPFAGWARACRANVLGQMDIGPAMRVGRHQLLVNRQLGRPSARRSYGGTASAHTLRYIKRAALIALIPQPYDQLKSAVERGSIVATGSRRAQIALWRTCAAEARAQADQMQDGSVAHTILITIAEAYERLAAWEEQQLPGG